MKTKTKKRMNKHLRRFLKVAASFFAVLIIIVGALLLLITHKWNDTYQTVETSNKYITEYGKTMVSAHRSGAGIFPENTMMAFEGCINSETFETDIFEFDLHITADDELIVLHDNTLDRTTDAPEYFGKEGIRPENYTYEELRNLNFGENFRNDEGETPFKGLRGKKIPDNLRAAKLSDVLTYLNSNGEFCYIIEIKNSHELGFKAADKLYETLKEMNMLSRVIVGTFNAEVTKYLDENYPDLPRSASAPEVVLLYALSLFGIDGSDGLYKFDALQIPPNAEIIDLATVRLINYAHRHNIAVQYWTINDEEEMKHLKEIGADCIMSDIPDVAYSVING